jgi:phage terminase Nu1 subunit (DNA packaging protein)
VNQKQLAQALGISPAMVTKLMKRGMPVDSIERATKWRKRHLEVSRTKGNRMDKNFRGGAGESVSADQVPLLAPSEQGSESTSPGAVDGKSDDFASSRARREKAEADRAELSVARELGKVADVDAVMRGVFDAFRSLRDAMMGISRKLAPQVATMHDAREIELAIDKAVREALITFSDVTGPKILADRMKLGAAGQGPRSIAAIGGQVHSAEQSPQG